MYENYDEYNNGNAVSTGEGINEYIVKVFSWMFIGLLVTSCMAYGMYKTKLVLLSTNVFLVFALAIAEVVLVFFLTSQIAKNAISPTGAKIGFLIYAVINGIFFSSIFLAYGMGLIYKAFFMTAIIFGVMVVYGKTTQKDLTSLGSILLMGLIGLIIASLLNAILGIFGMFSSTLDLILSYLGIVIFLGLTAYDMQKIKRFYYESAGDEKYASNLSILGALTLYLDFINILIKLLRIMGRRRN